MWLTSQTTTVMWWYPWYLAGGETQICSCRYKVLCLHWVVSILNTIAPHFLTVPPIGDARQMYIALVPTDVQIFSLFTMATNSIFANTVIVRYDTMNMGGHVWYYIRSDIQWSCHGKSSIRKWWKAARKATITENMKMLSGKQWNTWHSCYSGSRQYTHVKPLQNLLVTKRHVTNQW